MWGCDTTDTDNQTCLSANTELTRHAGGRSGQSHLPTRNQEARQNVENSHAKPIAMGTQKGANNATLSLNKTHNSQLEFMGRLKLRNLWACHVIEHARPRDRCLSGDRAVDDYQMLEHVRSPDRWLLGPSKENRNRLYRDSSTHMPQRARAPRQRPCIV